MMEKLIGALAGWKGYAAAALVAALIAGSASGMAAWKLQGLIKEREIASLNAAHAGEKADMANAAAKQNAENLRKLAALQKRLAAIDLNGYREYQNAKAESDRLRDDLGTGARRLWVRVKLPGCADRTGGHAPAGCVDDGTAIAELDAAFARSLLGIAVDGDRAIRKMTGLQGYADAIAPPP